MPPPLNEKLFEFARSFFLIKMSPIFFNQKWLAPQLNEILAAPLDNNNSSSGYACIHTRKSFVLVSSLQTIQ